MGSIEAGESRDSLNPSVQLVLFPFTLISLGLRTWNAMNAVSNIQLYQELALAVAPLWWH